MTYLSINENTLTELKTFDSVDEMNATIKEQKQAHELSETDRDILDAISRYSCKHRGVCYLSKQKIAEDAGYKSRRTAIRSCKRLEALGIIEQHETRRVNGDKRRSSNIIVITNIKPSLCAESDEPMSADTSEVTADSHGIEAPHKTSNSSNTYKETREGKPSTDDIIKRGLKHAIPKPIYDALAPFFNGQELYDTYGILLRAKANIGNSCITLEEHGERYIDAFYNVIRLYKAGKVRESLRGLLYVTWERLSSEISRQNKSDSNADTSVYFDWLKTYKHGHITERGGVIYG